MNYSSFSPVPYVIRSEEYFAGIQGVEKAVRKVLEHAGVAELKQPLSGAATKHKSYAKVPHNGWMGV